METPWCFFFSSLSRPSAPEDPEAPVSAALPVVLGAERRRHSPGDGAGAAPGAAAGQPVPGGDLCRHLRPPAGPRLPARKGEGEVRGMVMIGMSPVQS